MNRRVTVAAVVVLVVVVVVTLFLTTSQFASVAETPEFFVGVEYAYAYPDGTASNMMLGDVRVLVDRVKGFTNLFVFGNPQLTFNETALFEACDYVQNAGLYFIVLLTGRNSYPTPTQPFHWLVEATKRYGDRFLGVYRFDEPGGNQLDQGDSALFYSKNSSMFTFASLAGEWTRNLQIMLNAYANATYNATTVHTQIVTSDYGLYWFDYAAGYDVVFAEFGSNQSRARNIALVRGAASSFKKDWGAIVTWTYDGFPYIGTPDELYGDLVKAYCCGAKYAVVFNYPNNITSQNYGILSDAHLAAMEKFWDDIHVSGSPKLMQVDVDVAYVLPADYGFGFRKPDDTIWGMWPSNASVSAKMYSDVQTLMGRYDCAFDVVYDYPQFQADFVSRYDTLLFWDETVS